MLHNREVEHCSHKKSINNQFPQCPSSHLCHQKPAKILLNLSEIFNLFHFNPGFHLEQNITIEMSSLNTIFIFYISMAIIILLNLKFSIETFTNKNLYIFRYIIIPSIITHVSISIIGYSLNITIYNIPTPIGHMSILGCTFSQEKNVTKLFILHFSAS